MKDTADSVTKLYSSSSSQKKKEAVGKILQTLLTKQYPDDISSITLDQLLKWDLWPILIVVFSEFSSSESVFDLCVYMYVC